MTRIDELCRHFPDIPRSVVIKTDLLTQGVRFTPLAIEIGKWAIPEFLPWDREVHTDYRAIESDLLSQDWAWLPHSLSFPDGITCKVVYDFIRHHTSPYELQAHDGQFWLAHDGDPLLPVTFEKRPQWLSRRLEDGRQMSSIFVLASPDRLLGFPIRYCAFYQPEDICRFCCLNPVGKNIAKGDGYHDVIMSEAAAATCFAAAREEMSIRHITLTGGALRDQRKEAEIFARVSRELARVRDERQPDVAVQVMATALDEEGQDRLKDAGVDEVCFNMEVWEEHLWPEIVPGKNRHIGRANWMQRLAAAVDVFGRGRVFCQFVVGVEMVSGAFERYQDGIASVLSGIEWCAENGIQPATHIWCNTPGAVYEPRQVPPTEYFLTIARERHAILERHGMYFPARAPRTYSASCHRCAYLSSDPDFQWLRDDGSKVTQSHQAGGVGSGGFA